MSQIEPNAAMVPAPAPKLNNPDRALAIRRAGEASPAYVPHLSVDQVRLVADAAARSRHGERDRLLVSLLFDGCLRASEALALRPQDLVHTGDGWQAVVYGKGKRRSVVAISPSLAAQLQAYAYRQEIRPAERLFPLHRTRAFQIVQAAMEAAGVVKPDGVGAVHVLRHSGAIERLRLTGNPRAVQEQLRHQSAAMTLRYLKTLSHQEAMQIQKGVDFGW